VNVFLRISDWSKKLRTAVRGGGTGEPKPESWRDKGDEQLRSGLLEDAEESYRNALRDEIDSPHVLQRLAYVLRVLDQQQEAQQHARRALDHDPLSTTAHLLCADLAIDQKDLAAALASVEKAIEIAPHSEQAQHALHHIYLLQGDYQAVQDSVSVGVRSKGVDWETHVEIAEAFIKQFRADHGQPQKLIELILKQYRLALAAYGPSIEVLASEGAFLSSLARSEQALVSFKKASELVASNAADYYWRGVAERALGNTEAAIASHAQAIALDGQFARPHKALGDIQYEKRQLEQALVHYAQAIDIDVAMFEAYLNTGRILREQSKYKEAEAAALKATHLRPDLVLGYYDLANISDSQKAYLRSAGYNRQALLIQPDYPGLRVNYGCSLINTGDAQGALRLFKEAVKNNPAELSAQCNVVHLYSFDENCSPAEYLAHAQQYGTVISQSIKPYTKWESDDVVDRCLRVGLLSGDLHRHPVGFFLDGFLGHMDREKIEFHAFSNGHGNDELTQRLKSRCVEWTSIVNMDDVQAAKTIHESKLDLLLDLSGHTGSNRLPVIARRPAPVQASWLGYWASTGVAEMDYILVDPHCVPSTHYQYYSEKVWSLPDARMCFTPPCPLYDLVPGPLPANRKGFVTFGNYQHLKKVNANVLSIWGRVLGQLSSARLRVQCETLNNSKIRAEFLLRLKQVGIDEHRVSLHETMPPRPYMQSHNEVDIILDTFPFTGGTTTCNAMWMGVPTVTLAGNSMLSRQGVSMLMCAGLPDWIAQTEDEYVAIAVKQANDLPNLRKLRAGLRQQVFESPLMDAPRFAEALEASLRAMVMDKQKGRKKKPSVSKK
jgi:protein O-GlcNAc transferase